MLSLKRVKCFPVYQELQDFDQTICYTEETYYSTGYNHQDTVKKMPIINTTAKSKQKIQSVLEEGGGVAVLDFMSKNSSTATELVPIAEQLNVQHNIPLIKIDADSCPELSKFFLVDMIPTFVVVKQNWNNPIHIMNCNTKQDVTKVFHTAVNNLQEPKSEQPMMM